jgi:hypothetical protein
VIAGDAKLSQGWQTHRAECAIQIRRRVCVCASYIAVLVRYLCASCLSVSLEFVGKEDLSGPRAPSSRLLGSRQSPLTSHLSLSHEADKTSPTQRQVSTPTRPGHMENG